MIRKAKSIACTEFNFQELEKFNTISEVLKNLSIEKIVKYLYLYSFYVIGERFPIAESFIAIDSEFSYLYAIDIIEGRFPRRGTCYCRKSSIIIFLCKRCDWR